MADIARLSTETISIGSVVLLLACAKPSTTAEPSLPVQSTTAGSAAQPSSEEALAAFNGSPALSQDQFALAKRYAAGDGVERDLYLAGRWAKEAALQGDDDALAWLRQLADAQEPAGNLWLGIVYRYDYREPPKRDEAEALFKLALEQIRPLAEQGDTKAQNNLGIMYDNGHGVPKDPSQAAQWYQKAAEQGYAPAQNNLGVLYHLGSGVSEDRTQALQWYERAAAQGHVDAHANIARLFYNGAGVGQDYQRAAKSFRKAALAGDADSQFALALMNEKGRGVPTDKRKAASWYQRAVKQGHLAAHNNLGIMYRDGDGISQDIAKAHALFKTAALGGNANGQANLAKLYRDGSGVPTDRDQAKRWFSKAAAQGDEVSKRELKRLEQRQQCLSTARTTLFGLPLACAVRAQLRSAVSQNGGRAKREEDNYWYDVYDASKLLEGSSELQLGYTLAGDFAHALYVFPSRMDRGQVDRIAKMVGSKYGNPQEVNGDSSLGEVSYRWRLSDSIVLTVRRGWPNTTTYLEYVKPTQKARLDQEIADNKSRERNKAAERQSNAF